jgi:spermidine synthase
MSTVASPSAGPETQAAMPSESAWRLLLVSSAGLYLEMVLIRWLGTEVKIFAFFQNLTLIVCFLGFGVGCFTSQRRGSLWPSLAATAALVSAIAFPFPQWRHLLQIMSSILSYSSDAALWGGVSKLQRQDYIAVFVVCLVVVTLFLFLLSVAMIPLGRWVGHYLQTANNTVAAYSINLLGSLIGIWLLAFFAFLWLSPPYWFVAAFLLIVFSQPLSWRSSMIAAGLLAITLLALQQLNKEQVYWSPYQKLAARSLGDSQFDINVNNEGYMTIANVTPAYLAGHPAFAGQYLNSSYDSPFQFVQHVGRVLIVGSGAGNDVAGALRHGAEQVDAVEIDPLISTLGTRLHPERPYSSPQVRLITNDARNFMRQCRDQYDVVIFALLDSHTEFSGYSNMRVDNYVYTEESLRDAKRLLNDHGTLILKFEVRQPWTWMGQRFYSMLSQIFCHPPIAYHVGPIGELVGATVFLESKSPALWSHALDPGNAAFLAARTPEFPLTSAAAPVATTDDWPYIYHYGHSIPRAYYSVSAIVLLTAFYLVGPLLKPKESITWQFFLLGAGFLLMETQLVSRLALYFGTTWIVNCIALTGILAVLLLANLWVLRRKPEKLHFYYLGLCCMLIVDYAVPWYRVPGSGTFVGILICIAYCIPIFFAGVIFTQNFRWIGGSSNAFGANMLGSVAGGLAQNLSFVFGMKALLLFSAIVYASAAVLQSFKLRLGAHTPSRA